MNKSCLPRSRGAAAAFTLLEMVFVLGLIMVMLTWGVVSLSTVDTEQKLREAAGGIGSMAKQALNVAIKQQRAYQLTIRKDVITIAPEYALDSYNGDDVGAEEGDEGVSRERFKDVNATEGTDAEVVYEIKRWRSDEWEPIEEGKKIVITLDPIGLVEPISVRCSIGSSWLIQELHPLTAGVRDEQMNIVEK